MIQVLDEHPLDTVEMRDAYCQALIGAAGQDSRIVSINCDLCSSMGLKPFAAAFPDRAINVGIAEANGCSMAGGMAAAGMIPFFHTFAVFTTRRAYDQIFMCCSYPRLNVKLIGGDAGVSGTYNGGTHMAFEDVGILRVMPEMTILEPCDAVQMKSLVGQMARTVGVQYMRWPRKHAAKIYAEGSEFTIGQASVLRRGSDVSILSYGMTVAESLKAADLLAADGIRATVVDLFTIKPVDSTCIIECARATGAVVTVENHQVIGGLGSAAAEVLGECCPVPLERVGVQGVFGEVGQQDYLMERFGLTAPHIAAAARKAIARKTGVSRT